MLNKFLKSHAYHIYLLSLTSSLIVFSNIESYLSYSLTYSTDLTLMSKNKISGKPVRWMLKTETADKPCVLSFSGGHYDDEAVLIWVREENETLWTNRPVMEYNPKTRTSVLPMYMRMSRQNSITSNKS